MQVYSAAYLLDVMAAVKAAILSTATPAYTSVHLAVAPFAPNPNSDPSTFTEATFTGYAPISIDAWNNAELINGPIAQVLPTTMVSFVPSGTTVTNVIAGYWLEAGDGTYILGETFSAPVPLTGPDTRLNLAIPVATIGAPTSATVVP